MRRFMGSAMMLALAATSTLAVTLEAQQAQQAPVVPRPRPVGGLDTRPLSQSPASAAHRTTGPANVRGWGTTRPVHPEPPYRPSRVGIYPRRAPLRGVYPLAVVDAPYPRAGIVVVSPQNDAAARQTDAAGPSWMPTPQRPEWRIDTTEAPAQAWRDLVVTDAVCTFDGDCVRRERKTRAPWVAACRCYAFRDALGRVWQVD